MRDETKDACSEPAAASKAMLTEEMQASLALIGLRDGDLSPVSQVEAIKQAQQLHSQRIQRIKSEYVVSHHGGVEVRAPAGGLIRVSSWG